jgi:hypothetical protein
MITERDLENLGFEYSNDIFIKDKKVYTLGEEFFENLDITLPILYYNLELQTCSVCRGEFCIINRECKNIDEIIKFVDCINFLFNLKIEIKMSTNLLIQRAENNKEIKITTSNNVYEQFIQN